MGAFPAPPTSPDYSPISGGVEDQYLAAPSQVEAAEGRHGGQIAEASVRDAYTPAVATEGGCPPSEHLALPLSSYPFFPSQP